LYLAATSASGASVTGHHWGLSSVSLWQAEDQQAAANLVRGLGVTHFRPSVRWEEVQPDGPNQWDWSALDATFADYRAQGARVWALLESRAAPWATDPSGLTAENASTADCPPLVLPARDAPITGSEPYYLFVRAAVARYGDVVDGWLIDNEPSESWSWAGDSYSYAAMARLAAAAIHDADPSASAVLGAIPADTCSFMVIADRLSDPSQEAFLVSYASRMWNRVVTMNQIRGLFDNPAFQVWERVEFYRQVLAAPGIDALAANVLGPPARGATASHLVWSYQDQMLTHAGGLRPLLYTEIDPYLSDQLALAQETTQLMIGSLASGAVRGQSYLLLSDGTLPDVPEPDSGLTTADLQPKTGYYAYQTMISQLGTATLGGALATVAPLTGYWFQTSEVRTVYALWASESTYADLSSVIPSSLVNITTMTGERFVYSTSCVPVDQGPSYLTAARPPRTRRPGTIKSDRLRSRATEGGRQLRLAR
jgi:hypothetical protein